MMQAGNGIEVDDLSFNDESFGIVYCPKLSKRQVSDLSFNGDLVDEPINSPLEPIDEDELITGESVVGVIGPEAISNKKKYGFAALLLISLLAIVIGVSVGTRENANANVSSLNAQDKLDYCNKIMTQEMSIIDVTDDEDDEEGDDETMSRSASNDSLNVVVDIKAVRKYVAVEERVSNESRDVELNFGDRKRVLRGGKDEDMIDRARVSC